MTAFLNFTMGQWQFWAVVVPVCAGIGVATVWGLSKSLK